MLTDFSVVRGSVIPLEKPSERSEDSLSMELTFSGLLLIERGLTSLLNPRRVDLSLPETASVLSMLERIDSGKSWFLASKAEEA
jgi:hypothetical protein